MLEKFLQAAAAVLLFVSFSSQASDSGDFLLQTSVTKTSVFSIEDAARKRRCTGERTEEGRLFYDGACFGFPGEISSEFDYAPDGKLVRSTVCVGDDIWLSVLWGTLSKVFGHPRALISMRGAFSWTVGDEEWKFFQSGGQNRWFFVRERTPEAELRECLPRLTASVL